MRSLGAGAAIGLVIALRLISLASLIFAGALSVAVIPGTAAFLAVTVLALGLGLVTRFAPAVATIIAQSPPVAVLLPTVFAFAAAVGTDMSIETALATTFAVLGLTGVMVGLSMVAIAAFDLAWLARLMPATVLAGYFAGTAVLLILSTVASLAGDALPGLTWHALSDADLWRLGLTAAFAVAAIAAHRMFKGLGTIAVVVVAIAGFYGFGAAADLTPNDLRAMGLLPFGTADVPATLWADATARPWADVAGLWGPQMLGMVDWGLVTLALPAIVSAAIVAVLGSLLDFSGVELVARSEIPSDRFTRNLGALNVIGGALGVPATYLSTSTTVLAHELGGRGRAVPMSAILVLALCLAALPVIVSAMPVFVTAGLMVQLAWITLDRWVVRPQLGGGVLDRILVLGIMVVALIFGMAAAVGLGFAAAALIFAITYARVPVVRRATTLADLRSTVDRSRGQTEYLDNEGRTVAVAFIEGFLFFGSITRVMDHARAVLATDPRPKRMILDLGQVKGVDATALEAFRKLDFITQAAGLRVTLAAARPDIARRLAETGVTGPASGFEETATLDAALEAAEDDLLARIATGGGASGRALRALERLVQDGDQARRILAIMDRRKLLPREVLITAGAQDRDVFVVDQGRVSVLAMRPDGTRFRVRSMRAGALMGEIASYAGLPRTAEVIAQDATIVYAMTPTALDRVAATDPALAAAWHRAMAAALADKLNRTTQALRDLS